MTTFNDDNCPTESSLLQKECEESCQVFLGKSPNTIKLFRDVHVRYLARALEYLPAGFRTLDASRPWICYWVLHSLALLNAPPRSTEQTEGIIETLRRCQNPVTGGFCGNIYSPNQLSHAATTYAACLALATIGSPEALAVVDRPKLYAFFMSLKDTREGGFAAHVCGEVDVRVSYCVIAMASLYQILTRELVAGVVEYALACQSYEGGFGGEPGTEAHGGYTFCAVALLALCNKENDNDTNALGQIDVPSLCHWMAHRQMPLEGGYQGRTNKLVDGCYSFWQGSVPVILAEHFPGMVNICDRRALQEYILSCCQQVEGGLRDKPSKPRDYYHSCYCLSGLSIAQYGTSGLEPKLVLGDSQVNALVPTHPLYNITREKVKCVDEYFHSKPFDR